MCICALLLRARCCRISTSHLPTCHRCATTKRVARLPRPKVTCRPSALWRLAQNRSPTTKPARPLAAAMATQRFPPGGRRGTACQCLPRRCRARPARRVFSWRVDRGRPGTEYRAVRAVDDGWRMEDGMRMDARQRGPSRCSYRPPSIRPSHPGHAPSHAACPYQAAQLRHYDLERLRLADDAGGRYMCGQRPRPAAQALMARRCLAGACWLGPGAPPPPVSRASPRVPGTCCSQRCLTCQLATWLPVRAPARPLPANAVP